MDSLLRQTTKGGNVFAAEKPNGEHIDADEISMFAENALPEKAKPKIIKHLADCGRCRTILSNTIRLNAEAETEKAASVAVQKKKAEKVEVSNEIPWYQKLFAAKNLAFGMGALALIFAVGIGFIVLRNANESITSEVAQANTNVAAQNESDKSSSEEMANSNSTAMDANSVISGSNIKSNTETTTASPNPPADNKQSTNDVSANEPAGTLAENKRGNSETKDEKRDSQMVKTSPIETETNADADVADKEKNDVTADKQAAPPPPTVTTRRNEPTPQLSAKKRETMDDAASSNTFAASRKLNGKKFNYKNGVWYDSAYKNQPTINIKRGTRQYKNLDSGLRSIADKLAGTVVVVWKSKAYRIE